VSSLVKIGLVVDLEIKKSKMIDRWADGQMSDIITGDQKSPLELSAKAS
jgi:hypothetical protein